ncbi:hypothetical protein M407DRAFT_234535 [Tulasnella calospora MUT 4182]|uniref:Uncharacterized protein n=1 Tax=Tulasnella calospora MUT 4182 TaxID=1051891 RepID=A0A0C3MI71_9AGAM|nr:hypothetical protein M407DRAFT_234535 [Tulasnella calospora MUT 4182]
MASCGVGKTTCTMIRVSKNDRFLNKTEVNSLGLPAQRELIGLYGGGSSAADRAMIWARVKSGDLRVPCICLQYTLANFILDIDTVLIDAAVLGRVTLAGWELDTSGRLWPEEDKGNQRWKLEERTTAMEQEADDLRQRARASQYQQVIVKGKINELERKLQLSLPPPPTALLLPPTERSPSKRGREEA